MFRVGVREHILIAHSLQGEVFGPAQNLHGCTYVVDAEFCATELDKNNIVIDMGIASKILKETLEKLNYKNLDEVPQLAHKNTTTEFLAKYIFSLLKEKLADYSTNVDSMIIKLNESHIAWASYSGKI